MELIAAGKTKNRSLNGASGRPNFALSFIQRAAHEIRRPSAGVSPSTPADRYHRQS